MDCDSIIDTLLRTWSAEQRDGAIIRGSCQRALEDEAQHLRRLSDNRA